MKDLETHYATMPLCHYAYSHDHPPIMNIAIARPSMRTAVDRFVLIYNLYQKIQRKLPTE